MAFLLRAETGYYDGMSADAPADARAALPEPLVVAAPDSAVGQRLDRFMAEALPELTRSRVKTLIEAGFLTRDGVKVTQPAESVRPGGTYTLRRPAPVAAEPAAQDIPLTILHEDGDLLVIDKPAGLVVHPAPGNEDGTLVNALLAHCGAALPGIGGERRPGIVHRLDKDTSGIMVVAKTEAALAALSAMFAARDLDRAYQALVWGLPNPSQGEIEAAIGRDPRDRKRMAVVPHGGKYALTRYRVLDHHDAAVALLECRLATGRTHQIRVHLSHRGNPLVGDGTYLRRIPAAAQALPDAERRRLLDFPRQALHAARLGFKHPRTGEHLTFTTPPPPDMLALLECLKLNPDLPGQDY